MSGNESISTLTATELVLILCSDIIISHKISSSFAYLY